jgi:hypothetical protein
VGELFVVVVEKNSMTLLRSFINQTKDTLLISKATIKLGRSSAQTLWCVSVDVSLDKLSASSKQQCLLPYCKS